MQLFGDDGADTVYTAGSSSGSTIIGNNDSNDGADTIYDGSGADLVFGNGGNDTIESIGGSDTAIGGFGNDSFWDDASAASWQGFGNQGNHTFDIYGGETRSGPAWATTASPIPAMAVRSISATKAPILS
jgi:Ca2+-binding RTX toxin-like protein